MLRSSHAYAENLSNDCNFDQIIWRETRTPHFAFIFTSDDFDIFTNLFDITASEIPEDYDRYESLFGISLSLPLILRIYPSETIYHCINPIAPELSTTGYSTHIGAKEIAVIADRIDRDSSNWSDELLNAVRHQIGVLFVMQVTDNKAPPGLVAGVGAYAEDPQISIGMRDISGSDISDPSQTWRELWEEPDIAQDRGMTLQAMTIVAYLIDMHGWSPFQMFLNNLSNAESYRMALKDAYDINLSVMQAQWQQYYPLFYEERWQVNIFYNYDLSELEQLVVAGAYDDALQGLREALPLLEVLGRQGALEQAKNLMNKAEIGQEAGALTRQSRHALQNKDYQQSISLAQQAKQMYLEIGDRRRLAELNEYISWSQEVLDLQSELHELLIRPNLSKDSASVARLILIGERLAELGDDSGPSRIESYFAEVQTQRQKRTFDIIKFSTIIVLVMLFIRFALLLLKPAKEAQLL
jgi:hypothetical protein